MHKNLLIALINKGIVQVGTEVVVPQLVADLSKTREVVVAKNLVVKYTNEDNGLLVVEGKVDKGQFKISADKILTIDGMEPSRLAAVYGLKPDGSKKKVKIDPITGQPIKRGRKPKQHGKYNSVSQ